MKRITTDEALVENTARFIDERMEAALTKSLEKVFGDSDSKNPEQMRVLVRRIPILCTQVENMHSSIRDIKDNITWGVRIVVGAVLVALLGLILKLQG